MLMVDSSELRRKIIAAGYKAVEELVKVAEEEIISDVSHFSPDDGDGSLAADRLKNAAQAKKVAIFDAFEILKKVDEEKALLDDDGTPSKLDSKDGFAERNARKG